MRARPTRGPTSSRYRREHDGQDPIVDDEGLTIYYITDRFSLLQDLVVATRPDLASPFSEPTIVPLSLGPGVGEYGGDLSDDGMTMQLSIHLGAPPLVTNVCLSTRECEAR